MEGFGKNFLKLERRKSPSLLKSWMFDVLTVPRSTYYHSLQKTASTRERENHTITKKIIQIHQESKER